MHIGDFLYRLRAASRFSIWWNHVIAPFPSIIYLQLIFAGYFWNGFPLLLFLFLVTLVSTAALGYFLNDWSDIRTDALAGKKNMAAHLKPATRFMVVAVLLLLALVPWFGLPCTAGTLGALLLLIAVLYVYSFPPFRFKEKGFAGVLCDTLYGHVLPMFITMNTFQPIIGAPVPELKWMLLALVLLLLKGFRNILIHQVNDRKNDLRSGVKTLAIRVGPRNIVGIVNGLILPLEVGFLMVVSYGLSKGVPWFWLSLFSFGVLYILLFKSWTMFSQPRRQLRFKFWYFLNDYYEGWLPLSALVFLLWNRPEFWGVIPLHMLLFPHYFRVLRRDYRILAQNFFSA